MYSPKIKPELIKQLYRLKHSNENKTPMTRMVNEAVELYLQTQKGGDGNGHNQTNHRAIIGNNRSS